MLIRSLTNLNEIVNTVYFDLRLNGVLSCYSETHVKQLVFMHWPVVTGKILVERLKITLLVLEIVCP